MKNLTAGLLFLSYAIGVSCICYSSDIIKHSDDELIISISDNPCQIVISCTEDKQVIAVIYNVTDDCTTKGSVEISDGNLENNTLIVTYCKGMSSSYASRQHGLILKPDPTKELKPFVLDIYVTVSSRILTANNGVIESERYRGFISGEGETWTTPNNYLVIYNIMLPLDITIHLTFSEFRIEEPCERDYLQIGTQDDPQHFRACGDSFDPGVRIPDPIALNSNKVLVEFNTDEDKTLTGFTLNYKACIVTTLAEVSPASFQFPLGSDPTPADGMTCLHYITLRERKKIIFSGIKFNTSRDCNDVLTIHSDGFDITRQVLNNCVFPPPFGEPFVIASNITLKFSSVTATEAVLGFLRIESLDIFTKRPVTTKKKPGINTSSSGSTLRGLPFSIITSTAVAVMLTLQKGKSCLYGL